MKKIATILMLIVSINAISQNEISGTVTYYFNKYQGDKPDIGAKVYLVDSIFFSKIKNIKTLKNYRYLKNVRALLGYYTNDLVRLKNEKNYRKLLASKLKLEKKDKYLKGKYKDKYNEIIVLLKPYEDKIQKKEESVNNNTEILKKNKALISEDWDEYSSQCLKSIFAFEYNTGKNIKNKTINGIGTYTFKNVKNGSYYILFQSKNRTSLDLVSIKGKIFIKKIVVKDDNVDASYYFKI